MPLQAIRLGDAFPCSCSQPVPHVCGKVMGNPSAGALPDAVLIGGKPAATKGDVTLCQPGIPGAITTGSDSVFVHHKPLARATDLAGHGAVLMLGAPNVLVGSWRPQGVEVVQRGHVTITINRLAHTITFTGVQEYYGSGATQAYVDGAIASIQRVWSGPCFFEGSRYTLVPHITGRIRREGDAADSNSTAIHVEHTTQSFAETSSNPQSVTSQPEYGRRPGRQHDTDLEEPNVPAHEFAHSMGLKDGYITRAAPPPDPTRITTCLNGKNDILCGEFSPDARPTDEEIHDLASGENLLP